MHKDIIRLTNMSFYAHHGYYSAERELGQRFELDVELYKDLTKAIKTDDLDETIDFEKVYTIINEIFSTSRFTLIETVGGKIIEALLHKLPILAVKVVIRKPQVPIKAILDHVEIEIYREKE
ncbi:MAG: dihydroneopterin aldolase [Calditrichia bacterium]|nr:dihydroneopterin aldolase [Calditrichia bacterium]